MKLFLPTRFLVTMSLLACAAGGVHADSVRSLVVYNEGTQVFSRSDSAGTPVSAAKSGAYGSGSISASIGFIQVDVDGFGDSQNYAYVNAGGDWTGQYQINGTPAQQGTFGTANFTFSLTGTFSAFNVGVGAGQTVNYSFGLPVQGTTAASADYSQNLFSGVLPPQTITVPFGFTYGTPFDVAASLGAISNTGRSGLPGGAAGHAHLTLQNLGFTVVGGGSYVAASAGGTSTGASFAANQSYAGLSLTNTVGHQSSASLLGGSATTSRDVALNFITAPNNPSLLSDVLDVQGLNGDQYVLELHYDEAAAIARFGSEEGLMLSWLDPNLGTWVNAVDGNTGGAPAKIAGAYNPATNNVLGEWGQDTSANVVWAVVNHNSEFSVTSALSVPEPTCAALLGLAGLFLTQQRRRQRQE